MAVTLSGFLRCANDDEAARVRTGIDAHVRLTRGEPGCISFELSETDDPFVWRVEEEFFDPAAFEAQQARAAASEWAELTKGIERDYQITGMP